MSLQAKRRINVKSPRISRTSLATRCYGAVFAIFLTTAAQAQTEEATDSRKSAVLEEIVVTGSRFGGRIVSESPTPIDSISAEQLNRGGGTDLQSVLKVAVPSFSTPRPSAAGASDFLTSPTLRGLSTGQMLVLINGKRRHTNSDLNTNQQIGRGDVAYDFAAIPAFAIKSVEVLRDGAAAQYGSDAIGGVMNLILDDSVGFTASTIYGTTSEEDGEHVEFNAGAGFALRDDGSIRITAQYADHKHTDRARPDTRQQYFGTDPATGALTTISGSYGSGTGLTPSNGTLDPREATFNRDIWNFGEPDYEKKVVFGNLNLPLSGDRELYSFGGYSVLDGTSFNFLRRAGQDQTVRAIHPDGFYPLNVVKLENSSGAVGLRGNTGNFAWDVSTVYGDNTTEQNNVNSNNVSLGAASPTRFYRGKTEFRQWTSNFDASTEIPVGNSAPWRIAFGAEYRKEWYDLASAEAASIANGGIPILDGPNAGNVAPVGAQPSPGINATAVTDLSRDAIAVYGEVEREFSDRLLLSGAVRFEDYSDFGSTTNYKIAARFRIAEPIALRASFGTGFRAPALAQIVSNSANTTFVNGAPLSVRFVSALDPLADLVGAPDLQPEESENLSVGAVFTASGFLASVDYYQIELNDRLALSSNFQGQALTDYLAAQGFPDIRAVSFVTNGVDTTTRGIDVTASWRGMLGNHDELSLTFAANFNDNEIDSFLGTPQQLADLGITTPLFDRRTRVRLTQSAPDDKMTLDFGWQRQRFGARLTLTRYGEVSAANLSGKNQAQVDALLAPGYDVDVVAANDAGTSFDIIQHFSADVVADLEVSFDVTDMLRLSAGASNLFDQFPEEQIASTVESVAAGTNGGDNNGIFPYAYIAPYGTSGRFLYLRATVDF